MAEIINYEISESSLGAGAFGAVYKARDKRDGITYALKFIRNRNTDASKKFLEAWKNLGSLKKDKCHENITRYFGTWEETKVDEILKHVPCFPEDVLGGSGTYTSTLNSSFIEFRDSKDKPSNSLTIKSEASSTESSSTEPSSTSEVSERSSASTNEVVSLVCIKMELCRMNLVEWIEKKQVKLQKYQDSLNYFFQIAVALKFIHLQNFIHRDLKPKNILVSGNPDRWIFKIADFGNGTHTLAETFGVMDQYSHGTDGYTAPELKSNSTYNAKVDVFSLGVIFFEFIARCKATQELQDLREQLPTQRQRMSKIKTEKGHPLLKNHSEEVYKIQEMLEEDMYEMEPHYFNSLTLLRNNYHY